MCQLYMYRYFAFITRYPDVHASSAFKIFHKNTVHNLDVSSVSLISPFYLASNLKKLPSENTQDDHSFFTVMPDLLIKPASLQKDHAENFAWITCTYSNLSSLSWSSWSFSSRRRALSSWSRRSCCCRLSCFSSDVRVLPSSLLEKGNCILCMLFS